MSDSRARGVLEIITAIMLGLVSVATAAGAYASSAWNAQAGAYEGAAQQLRDRSLSTFIASDVAAGMDSDLVFEALEIEFDIADGAPDPDELRLEQRIALASGTPGLLDEWDRWVASGYADDAFPMSGAEFMANGLAPSYSNNRVSFVVSELAEAFSQRSLLITVASVVFAIALLLFGVSGVNESLRIALALAGGGAVAFAAGATITVIAMV